jgi:hypothetical protein
LTTIWVCPPKSATVQNPYLQGKSDVRGRARTRCRCLGSRGREFKSRQPDQRSAACPAWSRLVSSRFRRTSPHTRPLPAWSTRHRLTSDPLSHSFTPFIVRVCFTGASIRTRMESASERRQISVRNPSWHASNAYRAWDALPYEVESGISGVGSGLHQREVR